MAGINRSVRDVQNEVANEIRHGADGWELEDYSWDEDNGIGSYLYERSVLGMKEETTIQKQQPAGPNHAGWKQHWRD